MVPADEERAADGGSGRRVEAETVVRGVWSRPAGEILRELSVDASVGLEEPEVKRRRERHGPNRLREAPRRSAWSVLVDQFRGWEAPGIMDRPPRPTDEQILERPHWLGITGYAALITMAVLGALAISLVILDLDTPQGVTVSFLTLGFAQSWHVFNMAEPRSGILRNEVTANPWVWGALALCTALLPGAAFLPLISDVLDVADPGPAGRLLIGSLSLAPLLAGRLIRAARSMLAAATQATTHA